MINLNLIKKEPHEAIADIVIMHKHHVKILIDLGFKFDYTSLTFSGEFVISKEFFHATINKTSEYIYLDILDNKSQNVDSFEVIRLNTQRIIDISIEPLLSYLLLFKEGVEDRAKKSFNKYVKSEKE